MLLRDTATTYVYDAENRLVSASGGANVAMAYDPLGRLWRTSSAGYGTTQFLYDGDALVAEYDEGSAAVLRRYVHGQGADEPLVAYEGASVAPSAERFLMADHQGSIVLAFNRAHTTLALNTYDEYGIPGPTNGGRFQYTGQAWIPIWGCTTTRRASTRRSWDGSCRSIRWGTRIRSTCMLTRAMIPWMGGIQVGCRKRQNRTMSRREVRRHRHAESHLKHQQYSEVPSSSCGTFLRVLKLGFVRVLFIENESIHRRSICG